MAMVVPKKVGGEKSGEVGARDGGGNAGAGDAEGRESKLAEDKGVIANEVDEIGGDQGESDRANDVHALQSAAEGEIKDQWKKGNGERVHVRKREDGDFVLDAHFFKVIRNDP